LASSYSLRRPSLTWSNFGDGVDDAADERPADEARQAEGGGGPLGEPREVGRRQRGRRQPGAARTEIV
jgi:hypothetical protein